VSKVYKVLPSFTDWLGNEVTAGDLVIVSALYGRSASSWLGSVLEIRSVKSEWGNTWETKVQVQPEHPKAYNGGQHHSWPTEKNLVTGKSRYTGDHPKPLLIMERNVFRTVRGLAPILDQEWLGKDCW
jgi:hypothetical protein